MKTLIYILIFGSFTFSSCQNTVLINDKGGALGITNAPVSLEMKLNKNQIIAAEEGRLGLLSISDDKRLIPLQLESIGKETYRLVMIMPEGGSGTKEFNLAESEIPFNSMMSANSDRKTGQVIIEEAAKNVLQYNYHTVYEKDVIRNGNNTNKIIEYSNKMSGIYFEEYLKCHPEFPKDTIVSSVVYAIPRSDYIHPLYGLKGEILTDDWPDAGHPHHRGIFWSWPEVNYGTKRGDIYALQTVFARPTGKLKFISGSVYAEIDAENLWMWEDEEPIVRENAIIRVYRSTSNNRVIDLTIKLLALKDSVTIATRFTNSYGGLNIRMQPSESQDISYFTDKDNSKPIRAWSDLNGIFAGNKSASGLMVLQHKDNPEYPGDWVQYPNLAWVQPTFPTSGTRYHISTEIPLVLRYRLIIHAGGKPDTTISEKNWDAFNVPSAPVTDFDKNKN